MRNPLGIRAFDAVLNLFTSFGYFRYDFENMRVVQSAADSLKPGGVFVLDYLNIQPAMKNLVEAETVEKHGFTFQLKRFVENNSLIKMIQVIDGNEHYEFREEVNLLSRIDFERYFAAAGLKITAVFGDYRLGEFHQEDSPRLIFITRLI
jgi:SAM-dependent methyltransferase